MKDNPPHQRAQRGAVHLAKVILLPCPGQPAKQPPASHCEFQSPICRSAGCQSLEKRPENVLSSCLPPPGWKAACFLRSATGHCSFSPRVPLVSTHPLGPSPLTQANAQQPQDQGGRRAEPHVSADWLKAWPLPRLGAGPRSMPEAPEESRGYVVGDGGGSSGGREGEPVLRGR